MDLHINHPQIGMEACRCSSNALLPGIRSPTLPIASPCLGRAQPGWRHTRASLKHGTASVVEQQVPSAAPQVVKQFYGAINSRQLEQAGDCIAEECIYEDLVFSKPFTGRKAIVQFFKKFTESVSPDLTFVIDDISDGDSSVGVTWHLDWRGKPFPFSKGCSFYRCEKFDGKHKIIYGRDCVEPALKQNSIALKAIGAVTFLFERFPWLADRI